MNKVLALVEVLALRAVIFGLGMLLLPFSLWQSQIAGHSFTSHVLMFLVPLLFLLLLRRPLLQYGLSLANARSDTRTALGCFFPVALASAVFGFVPYTTWYGALILVVIQVGLLIVLARMLRKPPDVSSGLWTIGLAIVLFSGFAIWQGRFPGIGMAISNFFFYTMVGIGEETLNRGYTQSRLDLAFGKPFLFQGIPFGWGALITAVLFGLSHLSNGIDFVAGTFNPPWWWAIWTMFASLVYSLVREKTGSVVAPAILHGLPQALAMALIKW